MNKVLLSIVLALIIVGAAWYVVRQTGTNTNTALTTNAGVNSTVPANTNAVVNATTTTTTFTSTTIGYSFTYPAGYEVSDANDDGQWQIVRKNPDDENFVEVKVEVGSDDQAKSFTDFATERAVSYCAADGPDESIACSGVSEQAALTTPNGLSGLRLMLREVTETVSTNRTTTKSRGPVYALDTQSASKNKARVILVSFAASGNASVDEANAALAKTIAESVTFAE